MHVALFALASVFAVTGAFFNMPDLQGIRGDILSKVQRRGRDRARAPGRGRWPLRGMFGRRHGDAFIHRFPRWHFSSSLLRRILNFDRELESDPYFSVSFNFDKSRNWWEGPHVCKDEHTEEKNITTSPVANEWDVSQNFQCISSENEYTCKMSTKTPKVQKIRVTTYRCCYGFRREKARRGCTKELELKPLHKKLEDLKATVSAARAFDSTSVSTLWTPKWKGSSAPNYTVFAPNNEAFDKFISKIKFNQNVVDANKTIARRMSHIMMNHVAFGIHPSSLVKNDMILLQKWKSSLSSQIRINKYNQILTANCIPIVSRDNLATNGVVHVINKVMTPIEGATLMDLVSKNPQLTVLKKVLGQSHLGRMLKKAGPYTLFAPSDGAFAKLSASMKNMILAGHKCSSNLLFHHITPATVCSAGFSECNVKTCTSLLKPMDLKRTDDNKYFVNGAQVVISDIMATNGVMHIIDDVITPREALDTFHVLEKLGATKFLSIIRKHPELKKLVESQQDISIFVPTNEAFKNLPSSVSRRIKNQKEMVNLIKYHMADRSSFFTSNVPTLLPNTTVFVKRDLERVQCSDIVEKNIEMCSGVIHVIDEVMVPGQLDLLDTLAQHTQFSRFLELLRKFDFVKFFKLQDKSHITVFALTNKAFEEIDAFTYRRITKDVRRLRLFLRPYFAGFAFCCKDFLSLPDDRIMINGIPIKECGIPASNGFIHSVDSLLPIAPVPRQIFDFHDIRKT